MTLGATGLVGLLRNACREQLGCQGTFSDHLSIGDLYDNSAILAFHAFREGNLFDERCLPEQETAEIVN